MIHFQRTVRMDTPCIVSRVSRRFLRRRADLIPPLGFPGGRDHLIQRIIDEVDDERLERHLVQEVESGDSLSNAEASYVYDLQTVRGPWHFDRLVLTVHSQYRMDLRGITIPEIRLALNDFFRAYHTAKSRQYDPTAQRQRHSWDLAMQRQDKIEWTNPRIGLTLVFRADLRRKTIQLISAWWQGYGP